MSCPLSGVIDSSGRYYWCKVVESSTISYCIYKRPFFSWLFPNRPWKVIYVSKFHGRAKKKFMECAGLR